MSNLESPTDINAFWSEYGDHYIAVNEEGRLRRKLPMWPPDHPFQEAYQRPIDAGLANGHIVFFIHGGLNDRDGVVKRIKRFKNDKSVGFNGEPWHLINLAWDTSWGSGVDDIIGRLNTWRSWRNLLRLSSLALPWNWIGWRRRIRRPVAYFGNTLWRSEYDTAIAATSALRPNSQDRDNGFFRAFEYLSRRVEDGENVKISFVVHSAGAVVSNYLLSLIEAEFPNLSTKVGNYVLLAPACHVAHFQAIDHTSSTGNIAVLTLSPKNELEDSIKVYNKSLLWAIYDLFEANWNRRDFRKYRLPFDSSISIGDVKNRGLLGIEALVAGLETNSVPPLDRSFGSGVEWSYTGVEKSLGTFPKRAWTNSKVHGGFDDDITTLESVKLLLA